MFIPALLVGIFTVRWPVGVIAALGAGALLSVVGLVRYRRLDLVGWLILANYGLWLVSGLMIGGITPRSFIERAFYDGIGRVFLYYLPLLAFCILGAQPVHLRTVRWTMLGLAGATLGLLLVWLGFGLFGPSPGYDSIWITPFVGLLTSTTGAGTFAGAAWLFLEILARRQHSWKLTAAAMPMLIWMATTNSRQGMLASFATFALFIVLERRWRLSLAWIAYALIVVVVLLGSQPGHLTKFKNLVSSQTMAMIAQTISSIGQGPKVDSDQSTDQAQTKLSTPARVRDQQMYELEDPTGQLGHLRTRLILWHRAWDRFVESPLLGIGFARFNDIDRRWAGVPHVIWFAVVARRVYTSQTLAPDEKKVGGIGSAHNSYLHVLAETGLVGLGLLGLLWGALGLRLSQALRKARRIGDHSAADYFQAARLLLVYTLLGAFVGHGLAAPSVGVIVMTIAGTGLAYGRGQTEQVQMH